MQEIFKTCLEDSRYEVSNLGIVRNKNSLKVIKPFDNGKGYLSVAFWVNNNTVRKRFYVHRLVANAFIENPLNKKEVNHKDGNKRNNTVVNLEWVTTSENKLYNFRVLGYKISEKNKKMNRERMIEYQKMNRSEILERLKYYRNLRKENAKKNQAK